MATSNKGTAALALAKRGWSVFPLTPNSKIPLKGLDNWEQQASTDTATITNWWNDVPNANVGLATGPSGLLVLDFDAAKSPQEKSGIEAFRAVYPGRKLPGTYTVRTAGGGWHLYYLDSKGLRNTASKLAPKVDTRGQGGYVVAPGSVVDGGRYERMGDESGFFGIPNLPDWIVKELEDKPAVRSDIKPKGDSTAYALAALRRECETLSTWPEGGRNHQANKAAWNVSRFVARGELDQDTAVNQLNEAALICGLGAREAYNAIKSGMTRGIDFYGE